MGTSEKVYPANQLLENGQAPNIFLLTGQRQDGYAKL